MNIPVQVQVAGPLAPYAQGFRAELAAWGYTPLSAANQLRVMAHMSRWLHIHRLQPQDLTNQRIDQYLRARRRAGYTCWLSVRGLTPLLVWLRRVHVAPMPCAPVAQTALDRLLERYERYLLGERGLTSSTVRARRIVAHRFLSSCSQADGFELGRLTAADVTRFVLRECRNWSIGHAKVIVTNLRCLLRYLFLEGHTATPLASAAPAIAGWRLSGLPKALEPGRISQLLHSCDRRTAIGLRDYAILMLLARLGLRASEVISMDLDDIHWSSGEVVVRGKGRRQERMPLSADVGEALARYLSRGRPRLACRRVFLRSPAPQGPLTRSAVTALVNHASRRAGLPRLSPHRLRHTVATSMLQRGCSLPEVAQVLRHRSLQTTAIYAKVDRCALRALARPWPGGER